MNKQNIIMVCILLMICSCTTIYTKRSDTLIYDADKQISPSQNVELLPISCEPPYLLNGMTQHFPAFIAALSYKNGLQLVDTEQEYKMSIHLHQNGFLVDYKQYNDISIVFTLWHKSKRIAELYHSEITNDDFESFTSIYKKIDSILPEFIQQISGQ